MIHSVMVGRARRRRRNCGSTAGAGAAAFTLLLPLAAMQATLLPCGAAARRPVAALPGRAGAARAPAAARRRARAARPAPASAAVAPPQFEAWTGADIKKRTDIKSIMILGAGPIVIGQARGASGALTRAGGATRANLGRPFPSPGLCRATAPAGRRLGGSRGGRGRERGHGRRAGGRGAGAGADAIPLLPSPGVRV